MSFSFFFLLLSLALTGAKLSGDTEVDVDDGHDWDMDNINQAAGLDLLEGDIEQGMPTKNSIQGEEFRWPRTVPYILEDSLDMNAKGVILKAFDQYRLKTCLDFTPWSGEKNYISVFKGSGCFSSVGNQNVGKQRLSIGKNCDRLGTVEHEFLHALGFWHEQSRDDRDDYVTIIWDQIEPGKEHNFRIRDDSESSSLGVPYDYGSVMHYSKTSFNVGSEPTIVTRIPHFRDVIGQRMGFSANDLAKLNRLYNCTQSSTFVDSCDFEEENICGMVAEGENNMWERRSSVSAGPQTDFSHMGQCPGQGHFMHFSTASGDSGKHAVLKTRWFYPKPGPQCMQFFLFNSGGANDLLQVGMQEYNNAEIIFGKSISGGVRGSWELHLVEMNMTKKARVIFDAMKGTSLSSGGLSIDDINLSSNKCPQHVWHIPDVTGHMASSPAGTKIYSPRFLSPTGYSFQVGVYLNGRSDRPGYVAVYLHLTSGPNDHLLKWPCPWHQATMALMDQQSDIRQHMNMHRMVTTDPKKMSSDGTEFYWDNPRKVGSKVTDPDGNVYYRGPGSGTSTFITHTRLRSRKFIKENSTFFLLSLEDISSLLAPQLRSAAQAEVGPVKALDHGYPQGGRFRNPSVFVGVAVSVAAAVFFMFSTLVVVDAWRTRRRPRQESGDVEMVQNIPGTEDQRKRGHAP
ncbi:meprin A subunit beta-like isoform X2 [Cynoglossus semilaevis]|uniref:meprin A subunit beta-like isoform X2 n=1 Tax=Cynoglossus semilaevis TaxID=244447 RepID=UPI0007DCB56E|nr:meprin A subunit beta-like isoform X2 [Cynoglossus semilaevis]